MTSTTTIAALLAVYAAGEGERMSEDSFDVYAHEVVEGFAEAWASIDGKEEKFRLGKTGPDLEGHYQGYMAEAHELLRRASKRINSLDLFTRLDPKP